MRYHFNLTLAPGAGIAPIPQLYPFDDATSAFKAFITMTEDEDTFAHVTELSITDTTTGVPFLSYRRPQP